MSPRFPITRAQALERWQDFLPQTSRYGMQRNHVTLDHANVSRLSPALRTRVILEDEIVSQTLANHSLEAAEKWLQEVCWRRYWKGWLEMRPQIWRDYRQILQQRREQLDVQQKERLKALESGQTEVGIMNHFVQELLNTGYLHNHSRMWLASYWIHAERLPWELGADFFFRHLLDADPASNTLSWRWVAGLQTRGKTYLVRRPNLEKYCAPELLDDSSGLVMLEDGQIKPWVSVENLDTARQPLPSWDQLPVDLPARYGIWLHPDDLCLEVGELSQLRPCSIAAFTSHFIYSRYQLGTHRIRHLQTVLDDAVQRACRHYETTGNLEDTPDIALAITRWATAEKLDAIIAYAPFVGPVADALPRMKELLKGSNCPLYLIRRSSDQNILPMAKAGFFPFWENLKKQLSAQS